MEQSVLYREYFDCIKSLNSANDDYTKNISTINNNRLASIKRAREIYIDPLILKIRGFQWASVLIGSLSIYIFYSLVNESTSNSSAQFSGGTPIQGIIGGLFILGALGLGCLSLIVFFWTSNQIRNLNSSVKDFQEKMPKVNHKNS